MMQTVPGNEGVQEEKVNQTQKQKKFMFQQNQRDVHTKLPSLDINSFHETL